MLVGAWGGKQSRAEGTENFPRKARDFLRVYVPTIQSLQLMKYDDISIYVLRSMPICLS